MKGAMVSILEISTKTEGHFDAFIRSHPHVNAAHVHVFRQESSFIQRWELILLVVLAYVAIITPFEAGFVQVFKEDAAQSHRYHLIALFVADRLVDIFFFADMLINFRLTYLDKSIGLWVTDHRRIQWRYIRGWLVIDLVSLLPWDLLVNQKRMKLIKLLKLAKLAKLLRILRTVSVIDLIKKEFGRYWEFAKMFAAMTTWIHWIACMWHLLPFLEMSSTSWIEEGRIEYRHGFDSWFSSYASSVEFSLMCMVISYGCFKPITTIERVTSILFMMTSGAMYAYIIGSVCARIAQRDPASTEFQDTVGMVERFMTEKEVPVKIREEVRKFLNFQRPQMRYEFYQKSLSKLSPALRIQLSTCATGEWSKHVPFFHAENELERKHFLMAVSRLVTHTALPPKEHVFLQGEAANSMFVLSKGLLYLIDTGRGHSVVVSARKGLFGEEMLATSGKRLRSALTLTYVRYYELKKEALSMLLLEFGQVFVETCKLVRRAQIRCALRQAVAEIAGCAKVVYGFTISKGESFKLRQRLDRKAAEKRINLIQKRKRSAVERGRLSEELADKLSRGMMRADRSMRFSRLESIKGDGDKSSEGHEGAGTEGTGAAAWVLGDRVKVTKEGTQQGKEGTVEDADWSGRVKVMLDGSEEMRSYLPNELEKGSQQSISFCSSAQVNAALAKREQEKQQKIHALQSKAKASALLSKWKVDDVVHDEASTVGALLGTITTSPSPSFDFGVATTGRGSDDLDGVRSELNAQRAMLEDIQKAQHTMLKLMKASAAQGVARASGVLPLASGLPLRGDSLPRFSEAHTS
jgi:CRP-like cAMP-binding protein